MQTTLSFSLIFNQSINFIRNRFWQIAIVSLVLSLITTMIYNNLYDKQALIQLTQTANPKATLSYLLKPFMIFSLLSLIIKSIVLAVIYNFSINDKFNINLILFRMLPNVLNIVAFNVVYIAISIVGFIFAALIFIVLGFIFPKNLVVFLFIAIALIYSIVLTTIYYYFVGSIIQPTVKPFFQKFAESHKYALSYWKLAVPMVLIYYLILIVIPPTLNAICGDNILSTIVSTTLSLFFDIFTMCFFYRLNILSKNNETVFNTHE
ncbi:MULTISPECIES: hypothetical protein [unclassified Gilliamella]|uniref:hypothetical protein n=1 Tax=unclassified Gilliamella TaxID=2685620 RepID=UPI00080DCBCD|nr:hypothetical protein [Gilliamella apicola]OCG19829.1 hypothetical protein A9G23_08745 [Gilliamella apicola]OCG24326.1 hypothetical protein A9G22_04185 [Gilliamella apicola]